MTSIIQHLFQQHHVPHNFCKFLSLTMLSLPSSQTPKFLQIDIFGFFAPEMSTEFSRSLLWMYTTERRTLESHHVNHGWNRLRSDKRVICHAVSSSTCLLFVHLSLTFRSLRTWHTLHSGTNFNANDLASFATFRFSMNLLREYHALTARLLAYRLKTCICW
jgi:hypothetical protein